MLLHPEQKKIVESEARFKIIRAGRRGGKTILEVEDMSFEAASGDDRPIFYIAPTQTQARAIIWEELKRKWHGIAETNEARLEMKIPTVDGGSSVIKVAGWENRENFRGQKAWKIYFDEVDTMKDFFIGFESIFRPALTDFEGHAMFAGTPKKENPNLRRLEMKTDPKNVEEYDPDYASFHYRTEDNPHISKIEIEKARKELDPQTFRQEYLAEYVENAGALFSFDALVDMFSNTVVKDGEKYLIVDVADDGSDRTIFSYWEGLEEVWREEFERLNTEMIVNKVREYAAVHHIPYSHIAVDAIGVGAAVASSSLLDGIIGFKGSYAPIKTDDNIVALPNQRKLTNAIIPLVSDYKNLRSQCVFMLAEHVNNRKIASRTVGRQKENLIAQLAPYQDVSKGDGKRMATMTEDIKAAIGRSPDDATAFYMRMYFVIRSSVSKVESPERARVAEAQKTRMQQNGFRNRQSSSK